MAGITLTRIMKSFGATPILMGIDLDIRDGEFLTLVGPSRMRQVHPAPDHCGTRTAELGATCRSESAW